MVLHLGHLDDMVALLFEAQSNAARGTGAPTVVKYRHRFFSPAGLRRLKTPSCDFSVAMFTAG